jgi:hypothetical protein
MQPQPIENAIIIHAHLLQKFMKHKKEFANLLALYSFYIYHAQLQKANQPLATDEFTRRGMNWASDRVKKTKKLLKEMNVIEVVQKRQYSYIHLFFIYTKSKIGDILGQTVNEPVVKKEEKIELVKTPVKEEIKEKSSFEKNLIEAKITPKKITFIRENILAIQKKEKYQFNPDIFAKWMVYCENSAIRYSKNNLKHWLSKLNNRTSIEQDEAITKALQNRWKDFYLTPIKESKYHSFLGKSVMLEKNCDILKDIVFKDKKFVYIFSNRTIVSTASPQELFQEHGYEKEDFKKAPIVASVLSKIMGSVKRF